ncbi:MAG: PHB depolymerase family esterase [Pseudomonadota bacterium]
MTRPWRSILAGIALLPLTLPLTLGTADGAGRSYDLFDGRQSNDAAPLVILLHGMAGTGGGLRITSGFDEFAAARGLVAAYPTAPERRWNDGRWIALGQPDMAGRDDVGWIAALIDQLAGEGLVDAEQVYLLGHSNGGGMAMKIACDRPDLIKGVAIVSTKALIDAPCPDAEPVSAIFFHGTDDIVAPHGGRSADNEHIFAQPLGDTHSAAETVRLWAGRNRCAGAGPAMPSDPDPTDQTTLEITDWARCAAPLRQVDMIGGGHAYPGAPEIRYPPARRALGPPIRDIDAGEAALAFWFDR